MIDVREILFRSVSENEFTADITAAEDGILSGIDDAVSKAEQLGLKVSERLEEGAVLSRGNIIIRITGSAEKIAEAEDRLIGRMAKASGIATAADRFVREADGSPEIICGSWKKVPSEIKEICRRAIRTGGVNARMVDGPMVYIDKNFSAMLGGTEKCIKYVSAIPEFADRKIVIQIRGDWDPVDKEAWIVQHYGADVVFVDSGRIEDLELIAKARPFMENSPKIAFAGNVTLDEIRKIKEYPVDYVDVGRAIIDAPLLDMKLDVIDR